MSNPEAIVETIQGDIGGTTIAVNSLSQQLSATASPQEKQQLLIDTLLNIHTSTVLNGQALIGILSASNSILRVLLENLEFEKTKYRLQLEQSTELEKEKQRIPYTGGSQTNISSPDEIGEGIGATLTAGLGGGLGGLLGSLTGAGAMRLTKGMLGGLLRGGFFFTLGDFAGEALSKQIDDPTVSEIVETALPLAGLGMIFGPKGALVGALVGLATVGVSSVAEYLSGEKPLSEVNSVEWASIPIAGLAGAKLLNNFLAKSKIPAVARFGGIFSATPIAIAGLLALTLGVGLKWVADKIQDSKRDMLKNLSDYTDTIENDIANNLPIGTSMAQQEEGFFENLGLGDRETDIGKISAATGQAVTDLAEGGELGDPEKAELSKTIDKLVQQTDPAVLQEYFSDRTKTSSLLGSVQNLLSLAVKGQTSNPEEDARKIYEYMVVLSKASEKFMREGVKISYPAQNISQSLIMTVPQKIEEQQKIEQDIAEIERQLSLGSDNPEFTGFEGETRMNYLEQVLKTKQVDLKNIKRELDNLNITTKGANSITGTRIDYDDLIRVIGLMTVSDIQSGSTDYIKAKTNMLNISEPFTKGNTVTYIDSSTKDMSQMYSAPTEIHGPPFALQFDSSVRNPYWGN